MFFSILQAALLILLSGNAFAELDLRNASVTRLDNGMTAILLEDRNFPVVSVQMLYRVGARDESYGLTGIAHFLEHMAYRDTENFPDTDVVSRIYADGGEWHGYTWTDETTYFATVPQDDLDLLLRIEADRMERLKIAKDDMEAERGAVLAEMHGYENSPESMLLDAVMYASFIAHPYRNNTIGWESDVENIKHADVVRFYKDHYQPANAVLAVVGSFDRDEVLARIKDLFGDFEGKPPTPLPHTVEPVQQGERRVRLYGDTDEKLFAIAYRAPSVHDRDYAAFLVLQEILGASSGVNFGQNDWGAPVGIGSVLDGAANDLTTWYPPSAQDYVFVVEGSADGDVSEPTIEQEIETRIAGIRDQPPDGDTVAAAIANVRDQLVYDVATTEDAAHQLAFFAGLHALDKLLVLPDLVTGVSAADVQHAAQRWLLPRRRTIGWSVPDDRPPMAPPVAAETAPADRSLPSQPVPSPDTKPVPLPVSGKLSGGIPVIVQPSDLSRSAYLKVVLHGNDIAGEGIVANDPAEGYSSFSRRFRPDELQAAVVEARRAIGAARVRSGTRHAPSDDPATRLEQAFASVIDGGRPGEDAAITPALIVVSGDVNREQVLASLAEPFGDLQAAPRTTPRKNAFEPRDVEINLGHPLAQAELGYIVPAPGPEDPGLEDDGAYAYRLLLYIVSHGYEGRLGKEAISKRGLAYYIGSRYRSDGASGWITMAIGVDPGKLKPLKELMNSELKRLRSDPPTDVEIEEAKSYLVGRAESGAQSNEELSAKLAEAWLWYGKTQTPDELAAKLSAIGRQQVLDIVPEFTGGATIIVAE